MADLLGGLVAAAGRRVERLSGGQPDRPPAVTEDASAEQVKRRLDASHERLKREIPPSAD